MTSEKVKVADYIARRLALTHGVTQVFMVTGGGAMHLNDAFGRQAGLHVVFNHHEQACAIAAEGYARVAGKLAVVNVTTGPGGTNALTGVLGQWTDSVPALYVSGQIKQETSVHHQPELALRQLGDQEVDIIRIVAPITKYARTLRDPRQARAMLDEAVRTALEGRPGPVWLDVPLDVQGALVSEDQMLDAVPDAAAAAPAGVLGPAAAAGAVAEVLRLLAASSRPVLLAGHGVRVAGAQQDLLKLVALLKVPVLGTFNGTDLIPSAHPNFAGRIGTIGGRAGNFVLQNADLLLSLGSRNNIRQVSYGWKTYARGAKKVVVDIDPAELGKHTVVPDLPVCMDAGAFIRALSAAASAVALPDWSPWLAWAQERKRRYPVAPAPAASGPVNPYRFVARLSAALGEGAVVVTANATPSIAGFQSADIKPGQRWLWNSGCASMGWDLPAAVGASCALGRGQVVCLSGDGSSMLNIQELATIAQNRLPIKIFLFNNGGYSSIRQTQAAYFERRWVGIDAASGVGFPDFVKLAGAFGLKAERLTDEADADAVIRSVLAEAGPVLCEVVLPTDYAFEPKLSSARLPDGRMVSKPLEDLSPLLDRDEFRSNMIIPVLEE